MAVTVASSAHASQTAVTLHIRQSCFSISGQEVAERWSCDQRAHRRQPEQTVHERRDRGDLAVMQKSESGRWRWRSSLMSDRPAPLFRLPVPTPACPVFQTSFLCMRTVCLRTPPFLVSMHTPQPATARYLRPISTSHHVTAPPSVCHIFGISVSPNPPNLTRLYSSGN